MTVCAIRRRAQVRRSTVAAAIGSGVAKNTRTGGETGRTAPPTTTPVRLASYWTVPTLTGCADEIVQPVDVGAGHRVAVLELGGEARVEAAAHAREGAVELVLGVAEQALEPQLRLRRRGGPAASGDAEGRQQEPPARRGRREARHGSPLWTSILTGSLPLPARRSDERSPIARRNPANGVPTSAGSW